MKDWEDPRDTKNGATDMTTVVNVRSTKDYDVYIGRGMAPNIGALNLDLGNPFVVGKHGTRQEVLLLYARYFKHRVDTDPEFKARVNQCKGKVLGCWCKPSACHGDIIAAWLNGGEVSYAPK